MNRLFMPQNQYLTGSADVDALPAGGSRRGARTRTIGQGTFSLEPKNQLLFDPRTLQFRPARPTPY
jgi:hypothetical protein